MKVGYFAVLAALLLVCGGCSSKAESKTSEQKEAPAPVAAQSHEFNTSNKDALQNNNIVVAMSRLNGEPLNSLSDKAEKITASKLTKSPYSAIGKVYKITGKVYKVEELPPDPNRKGKWSEMLMITGNSNSPTGSTTVDFIYNGDASDIDSGQVLTCSGYFIGTFDSDNAMGGKVEAVTLVGNSVKHR